MFSFGTESDGANLRERLKSEVTIGAPDAAFLVMTMRHDAHAERPWLSGHLVEAALSYQRALQDDEKNPTALVAMSLIALASRQYEAAIQMARAAIAAAPAMDAAWAALGQALKAAGRCGEAKLIYCDALRRDGTSALLHLGLGELLAAEGLPEQAIAEYEAVIRHHPAMAVAHLNKGNALAYMSRDVEALDCYERAAAFAPKMAEAEFGAAFVLARLGCAKDAERRYRRTIVLRPDFAAAWMNLGCVLRDGGQDVWAEAALQKAVALNPNSAGVWINLSLVKRDQKRWDEAAAHLRKAFALDPQKIDTRLAWCQLCAARKDLGGAWAWLRWALMRHGHNSEVVNMRGVLLHTDGRYAEAIEAFEQAEHLGSKAAISNRGNSLMDLGRMEESLRAHETAVERDPQHAGALYNLALLQLRLGDWEHGWTNYEARWRFREVHRTPMIFRQPRWRGDVLQGKRVLLHAEQGLGDAIQFCRYAAMVAARGGDAILQVHEPVARLMKSLAVVRAGHARVARLGVAPPDFDVECPLMSLPAVFGTCVETVPWTGPYLGAEPELVEEKKNQLSGALARERSDLCVGIAWAGNPKYRADARRSMALAMMEEMFRGDEITWISLQKGEAAEQLKDLPQSGIVIDGSSADKDLAETAALVSLLDLVITTDTCIAHLAGAMGKPVWILLPHLGDWRWMEKVETTPWYPTARLFRQQRAGDWAGLLERVIAELRLFRSQMSRRSGLDSAQTEVRRGRAA